MNARTVISFLCFLLLSLPAFAAEEVSALSYLSDPELDYYDKIFMYTMDNIQDGKSYDWSSYGGKGTISMGKSYVSKSGSPCREFNEKFSVQGHDGTDKGIGCKRKGSEGWCKLKDTSVGTCALETSDSLFFRRLPNMPNMNVNTGGGVGRVGSPNVDVNVSGPNVNLNYDNSRRPGNNGPSGAGIANKVTGTAGSAAGTVVGTFREWFVDTFVR